MEESGENRGRSANEYIYDLLQLNIDISTDRSIDVVDAEEIIGLLSDAISILNQYEQEELSPYVDMFCGYTY